MSQLNHEVLDFVLLGNALRTWLVAFAVAVGAYALLKMVVTLVTRRVRVIAQRTVTRLDDLAVELLRETRKWFLRFWAAYFGTRLLAFDASTDLMLSRLIILATLLQAGIWGTKLIAFWIENYFRKRAETDAASATTIGLISTLSRAVLFVTLVLMALNNFGVNITALVAGLGVGGIAVALAAQNVLGDLFASLTIVLDKPFVVGEAIGVGDFSGVVETIGLKNTRVRSLSGELLIFANNDLLQSRLKNYKRMAERRVLLKIGVAYETPVAKLERLPALMRELVESKADLRIGRCHLAALGDSAIVFELEYWVRKADYVVHMDRQQELLLALLRRLEEEKVEVAYPTQTLHVRTHAQATS